MLTRLALSSNLNLERPKTIGFLRSAKQRRVIRSLRKNFKGKNFKLNFLENFKIFRKLTFSLFYTTLFQKKKKGHMAQLVEYPLCTGKVLGSNPNMSISKFKFKIYTEIWSA